MSKDNLNENNITINDNKKSKKQKVIIGIIIALVIVVAIVAGFAIKSYAYQYRFEHVSDEINMSNNSVTYRYYDNEDGEQRDKTYAITDEWLHRMIVRNQPLDNDWDSNPIATDTTIYGPYTWIPAGKYVITFDLTDEGGHAFQYWDVGVNFGNGSCGQQDWDASYSQSNPLVVGKNGATIYNSHYWRDSSGPHLQYTINTTGDTADYEFRLYFSSSLGNDIPFTGTGDMSIKKDFLNSVKIEAETANTISFNADGGTVNGKTTGTLTSTYWGKSREKVSVPTKEGYTFAGWYGYSKATNTTSSRSGLSFDKNSEKIKLWNADGTPAIKTEVSYNDYTVYAEWKPNYNLEVNWDSGVSYVKGTDIDGNTITINEGESYEYHYNYAAPTYIYLKEGYAVDYITETSDNNHKWTDTTKNDTLGRWENRWTMNKDRTIYIHTKIADDYCSLTLNGDEGVEKIEGFTKGETKLYKKGTKVTYKFKVKDGYELDYISEGNAHYSAIKLDNDKDGYNYSDYYNINGNRSGYIHTKPASYTLTIDPNGGEMYNGNAKTSSVFTTKFLYGRKTYIGNSYTDKYGYLNYENNTPTKEGYTFAGWKFSNGTGGLNSDGSEFFFGDIAANEDTTYDDDDIYIFNGNYTGDVTATAQWTKGSYQQNVYVRYQNEDGSWGDYSDKYWHKDGYWERFWWHIDNGSPFRFGLEDIEQDSRWDADIYEFPDTFADGTPLSYTVTKANTKYIDIKRKNYTITFGAGKVSDIYQDIMDSISVYAGDTYTFDFPENKYVGREFNIRFDTNGGDKIEDYLNRHLHFDYWKNDSESDDENEYSYGDNYGDNNDGKLVTRNLSFEAQWMTENVPLPEPTKEGYTFAGWYEDKALTKKVNGTTYKVEADTTVLDVTLYAKWTSQTASYTVKHHYMDVNGKYSDGTGLLETETLKAQVGSNVTPKTKARTGFTSPKTQTVTVKADGTTVVDYYYARNKYSITYKKGNTDSTQTDVADNATYDSNYTMKAANTFTGRTYNVKYDKGYTTNRDWEKTTLPSNITNAHLTFKNWAIEGTTKNAEDTFKYTYAKNVTATAQWNAANIKFTSVTRTGYTFAGWKCSVDGKIYKAGDTYTINEGTSKLDVTFTATWTANTNTKYVVKHWKQNIGGNASQHNSTNYTLADTDNFTGTTDTTVRPSVKNYEGFTAPSVQTVAINGDGSTVVNYYYTRNKYTIANVDITIGNGISNVSGLGTYYYGQEVTLTANLKSGYHWHTSDNCTANKTYPTGWYATQNGYGITTFTNNTSYSSQSIKFTMPARSIKVGVKATNNTYYISFNKNRPSNALSNVNGSMNNQTFIYTDTTASTNNTYTLDGWDFKGWTYENLSLANQFSVKALTDKDIKNNLSTYTVYAKWEDKVPEISIDTTNNIATTQELTLKASDSGSGVASYYFGTSNPKTTTVTYNTINPINKDYSRKETVKDAGTYYFSVQDRNGKVSTSSITFYKTTFNTNKTHITNTKGEVITDNFTSEPVKNKDFNVDYSINASGKTISPVVSRDGNEFLGWNSKPDVNSANKTITVGSNTTYYCIWKDSTKPVIRLDSLTSDTNTTEQTLVFSMFDTRDNGNKTGSDIKGYYIGTNKTNPTANEFKKVEINTNGNATVTLKINKNTFKPDTSYYIFAVDKAGNISECMTRNNNKDDLKFVTINYEANGTASSPAYLADGVLKEIYIPVNTVVYPLPKAERIGYHDLLSEQWQSLNYTTSWSIKAQSDNIAKPTRMWQADKSITLYACWAANTWTVTFDYNKPSNAYYDVTNNNTKSKTVTYDSAYGSLPSPALNGWKFVGWFTEQTNGTLITKDTIVRTNNNHTLYAHWEHTNFDNSTGFTINYWTENLYRGNNQNNGYSDCKQIGKDTTDYYSNYKTVKVNKINGKSIYADETIKDILAENYLSADEKTYLKGFTLAYSVIGGGINNSKEVNTSLDNRVYHQYKDGRWIEFSSVETYNPAINTNPSVTVHIDASGKTVIDFYYKRNSYTVNPPKTDGNDDNSKDPSKATDIIPGNGIKDVDISDNATGKKNIYKYEEVVTLTANTKDGYHWHYDSDTELNKKSDDCYTRNVKHLYPSGWVDNSKNINRFYTDTNGKTSSLKDKTIKFYMPSSDVNLSVGATNNSYEVTFNKNTPNGRINDITKDVSNPTSEIIGTVNSKDYIYNHKDDETVLPESIYSITGWDFIGWSRKTDVNAENADTIEWGYNKNSWNSDLSHLTTDNNVTVPLYAKYIAHTYTIKIHPNKPQQSTKDLVVTKPNEYEYNKTDNVLSKTLTYDAINYIPNSFDIFKIEGWSSLSYNYKISDTKYLIDYSDTNNKQWNLSPDDKIIIDFYTRWSENTYNVKFSEQGGTKVSGLVTIMSNNNNAIVDMDNPIIKYNVKDTTDDNYKNNTYESTYKMPNAPIRPGYNFISWNINEDVDNASDVNYLAGQAFSSIAGKIDNSETKLDNELTFYALWEKKKVATISTKSKAMGQNTIRDNAKVLDNEWYNNEISGNETILQEWNVDAETIKKVY